MNINARVNPDTGQIAQLLHLEGVRRGLSGPHWVSVTTGSQGQVTVELLKEQDVVDWIPLVPGGVP